MKAETVGNFNAQVHIQVVCLVASTPLSLPTAPPIYGVFENINSQSGGAGKIPQLITKHSDIQHYSNRHIWDKSQGK